MGTIFCWRCGSQVSDQEMRCPNCGASLNATPNQMNNNYQQPYQQTGGHNNKLLYAIIGLLVALLAGGLAAFLLSRNSEKEEAIEQIKQQQEILAQKNEQLQQEVDQAKAQAEKKEEPKQAVEQPAAPSAPAGNPVSGMSFIGSIGGDNGAYLEMPSGSRMGSYRFINFTRNTKFTSYNPSTGALVISAYELGTGKYIGKFVGTLKKLKYGYKYTGTFTNYKGGKVNFNLEEIND